jgi:hypothetical protein
MKRILTFMSIIAAVSLLLSACQDSTQTAAPSGTTIPSSSTAPEPSPGSSGQAQPTPTPAENDPNFKELPGKMLIADRGNSRLLIVTPDKQIIWQMEIGTAGPSGASSLGADDAFLTPDKKHIIINEEDNHVIAIIDIATKKIIWSYGHAGQRGSKEGYLNTPDDAFLLPDGNVTVADIKNHRILFISPDGKIIHQYGTTGVRKHNPPQFLAAPNGGFPLPDGGVMITEIGGSWADRLDKDGKLVYSVHFKDIAYPSDAQLLDDGTILTVDYSTPGKVEKVKPDGTVVAKYAPKSGPGMLAKPSLAIPLPNGNIAVNDDYNHRVVILDPDLKKIVWQYGKDKIPGTDPGYLNTPDGMDFIPPDWQLPTASQ